MDHNPQGRRPHYHRSRRGGDRRGSDRRAPQQPQDQPARPSADQVDVEQIMRDIRGRIAQRHGIELSTQQIQELAARRLEAILDPRNVNPTLLEQLRRGAAAAPEIAPATPDPGFSFEDTTLYESHRGLLRFIRRLLNPILKLFFNPNPLIHALHTQARLNSAAAAREAQRERLQAEWNALHYELLQRLVTEVSRVSIEVQALSLRVESLSTKVDFNDRRVRTMEGAAPQPRQQQPCPAIEPVSAAATAGTIEPAPPEGAAAEGAPGDGNRRRRRRRRGRRGGAASLEGAAAAEAGLAGAANSAGEEAAGAEGDLDEGDEDVSGEAVPIDTEPVTTNPVQTSSVQTNPVDVNPVVTQPAAVPPADAAPPPPELPTPPRDEPAPEPPVDRASQEPPER